MFPLKTLFNFALIILEDRLFVVFFLSYLVCRPRVPSEDRGNWG